MRIRKARGLRALSGALGWALAAAWWAGAPALAADPFAPFMTPAQEIEVGRSEHPKVLARFGGVYDDPGLGGYVAMVGGRLVANSETPRYPFTFTVLNSPVVNAFALPGGYVYVTRGLLALANSEAELAGVLAHEIGHITARHPAQRYSRGVIANLGATFLGMIIESPQLLQLSQLGSELFLRGYSRDEEYESDLLGVGYLNNTGYNPWAQAKFLESLEAQHEIDARAAGQEGGRFDLDFFATHPRTADRIARAIEAARASGAPESAPFRRREYLREIDGLLFGDDPEQGFVRGRVFAHPKLRFAFTVPPGFRLLNDSEAVVAQDSRGAIIRFDGEQRRQIFGMAHYLTRVWRPKLVLSGVESLRINGMEAAAGGARVSGPNGALDVWLVAIRHSRHQIHRFLFATPPELTGRLAGELRRTAMSFRRLSAAEAAGLKPVRVRLVSVAPGDTPERMAKYMAVDDFPLERFHALNALRPGQGLAAGQVVKLVWE